jgi:hypothetical protein
LNVLPQIVQSKLEKISGGYFDASTHSYFDEVGERVPGTTSLLEAAGLVCYQHIPATILSRKAEIGTAAHAAAHYYDEGDLNECTLDTTVQPYFCAWKRFRDETDFAAELIEFRGIACINGLKYGWTLDRTGILRRLRVLLEIKCTANVEPSWGPQTAAYDMGASQIDGEFKGLRQRIAVWLRPNESYRLIKFPEAQDFQIFKVALRAGYEQNPSKREQLLKVIRQWMETKGKVFDGDASSNAQQ